MSLKDNTDLLFQECSKPNPDINTIQNLIALGIDPLKMNQKNENLLMTHLVHSNCPDPKIITLLVNAGVKIQGRKRFSYSPYNTPLMYAGQNNNSSLEVFQTLLKLGAHIYDSTQGIDPSDPFQYDMASEYCRKNGHNKDKQHIVEYLMETQENHNAENTQVNGLYLHRALEKYIIESDNPDASEISKIIQSYKHIPGIYPTNYDMSRETARFFLKTKIVSLSLFQTLKVFYLAAAKRCSIEVFQALIFEYGIEMAERFDMNLFDILAGNYCLVRDIELEKDFRNRMFQERHGDEMSGIMEMSIENILSSYIQSCDITRSSYFMNYDRDNTTFDYGDDPEPHDKGCFSFSDRPFDLHTFKYLVSVLKLNYGTIDKVFHDSHDIDGYFYYDEYKDTCYTYHPLHPLLKITSPATGIGIANCDTLKNPDTFLDVVAILLDSDMNINITDNEGNNVLINYITCNCEIDDRVITALIKAGIDLNYKNKHDNDTTALMYVIDNNLSFDLFKTLIEAGADIYHVDSNSDTILSYCLSKLEAKGKQKDNLQISAIQMLTYLLSIVDFTKIEDDIDYYYEKYSDQFSFGPDLHTSNIGYDCLANYLIHSKTPNTEIITTLIESGVDMNYKYKNHSHLCCAISLTSSSDVIKCLVEHGASVNDHCVNDKCKSNIFIQLCQIERNRTTFSKVCKKDIDEKFNYLTSFLCSKTDDEKPSRKRKLGVDNQSLLTGVNRTSKIYITGDELLEYCSIPYPNVEVLNILVNLKDIDVNRTNTYGHNALMALLCRNIDYSMHPTITSEMITTLVKANIDINYKNKEDNNHTALYYACIYKCPIDICNILIEHGAIVNEDEASIVNSYLKK